MTRHREPVRPGLFLQRVFSLPLHLLVLWAIAGPQHAYANKRLDKTNIQRTSAAPSALEAQGVAEARLIEVYTRALRTTWASCSIPVRRWSNP